MREIDKVLNKDEKIIWEGKPSFWPYIFLGFGRKILPFFIMLIPLAGLFFSFRTLSNLNSNVEFFPILFPFLLILVVFLAPLFNFIYKILVYRHIVYFITDKRVVIQGGLIGRDFDIIDFDKINNSEVKVDLNDKIFGGGKTGTIFISLGDMISFTARGVVGLYVLTSIQDPYTVFNLLKKVSFDVKTDINYPNKLRPNENPGYKVEYNSKEN